MAAAFITLCAYINSNRRPSVPIPPETNSRFFFQAPYMKCSTERDSFTTSSVIFGWALIGSPVLYPYRSKYPCPFREGSSDRIMYIPRYIRRYLRTSSVANVGESPGSGIEVTRSVPGS